MEKKRRGFWIVDFGLPIGRRGQSTIEYLVVATAVILAILAFKTGVKDKVEGLGDEAVAKIDATKDTIGDEVTPSKR